MRVLWSESLLFPPHLSLPSTFSISFPLITHSLTHTLNYRISKIVMSEWHESTRRSLTGSGIKPSWIRSNLAALQKGHVTAHAQRAYSLQHPRFLPDPSLTILRKKTITTKTTIKKTKKGRGRESGGKEEEKGEEEEEEEVIFGRPSGINETTMKEVLEGHFFPKAAGNEERDYPLIGDRILYGRVPKPRPTKASALLQLAKEEKAAAAIEKEKEQSGGATMWKMSKWDKVEPKLVVWA